MSHTINIYVLRKETMKPSGKDILKGVPHVEENGYYLLPLSDKIIDNIGVDYMDDDYQRKAEHVLLKSFPDMAWAETDYFGGVGEQDAKAWVNRLPYKEVSQEPNRTHNNPRTHMSINRALKAIGVVSEEGKDEFDTINLGRYRDNHRIISEWEDITGKTTEKMIRRVLLKGIPKEMKLYWVEERVYTTKTEYVCMTTMNAENHPYKQFHRCVDESQEGEHFVQNFKETRTRTDEAEFLQALTKAISHVKIMYVVDTIYKFMTYTAIPLDFAEDHATTLCAVEYECDHQGVATLHNQVTNKVLMYDDRFAIGPYQVGRNTREEVMAPKKPKLVKKTVEVYVCPECEKGELEYDDADMHKCTNCGHLVNLAELV